jgi:hypothetical protein
MFLCASGNRLHNFWWFMREAGWFDILDIDCVPETLRDIFLNSRHRGPFNLYFDCFYDFPSRDPSDLIAIFGRDYALGEMTIEARAKINERLARHRFDAIVSFNGQVTSRLLGIDMAGFTTRLNNGELLEFVHHGEGPARGMDVPLFQTYPAGFIYTTNIKEKRLRNLAQIREKIFIEFLANQAPDRAATFINEPAVLLKIGKFFSPDLAPIDLYDGTRGYWKIGQNREQAHLAFSVYRNIILEVYEIVQWFPAGTTFSTRSDKPPAGRWEFIGNIARPEYRDKYRNKSVGHYFPTGARNPVRYINI